jgi:protein phosphatase
LERRRRWQCSAVTEIQIPDLSLVVLVGPSGAGKSTFARTHFKATEIGSSDACRGLVSDDENDLSATGDAFELLHYIAARRLERGRLTVIDATSVKREDRKPLVELARRYHVLPVAIVLNMPERLCRDRNRGRPDRTFGSHVIRSQLQSLRRSLGGLQREGFRQVSILSSPEEVESVEVQRQRLFNDLRHEHGPFDVIGDVHGCCDELEELLKTLGYEVVADTAGRTLWGGPAYKHPNGRKAIFLGDLVDRGPRILDTVRLVRNMIEAGSAICIPGNHDVKLLRKLRGRDVQITHGLDASLREIDAVPDAQREQFSQELAGFIDSLISHYVLDDGKLVVAHAGLKQEMQGRASASVRSFSLYGETTGETDEYGLPVRYNWAADYRGRAMVVYGHTPVARPEWLNRTINIDTGCVFGGSLTALRYPEGELVSVPARATYYEPVRPLRPDTEPLSAQQREDEVLDIEDVLGKRIIRTRLQPSVTVREEQAIPALEVMSRFAVNPKWLIYLPPTMAPSETSKREDLLEHPAEALAYFRSEGVPAVMCEEKHMGSRAVAIVCRDEEAARTRFGVAGEGIGVCYTRTGRRFFDDPLLEREMLERLRDALERSGLWDRLETDWICLDCELMPWSVKAQDLLKRQYAAVGAAGEAALGEANRLLQRAMERGLEVKGELERTQSRLERVSLYREDYRRYCWPVSSLDDLKLAPFHLLASQGKVHIERDHCWHMETLGELCRADDGLLLATACRTADLTDAAEQEATTAWWEDLTERGGEGMVVKPLQFVIKGQRGLVQPALKCRGREYLRLIYGPEYTSPENLDRLRKRGLGLKRSLAAREFALGIEALERFVRQEPLRRVHECVFGVLALESEPVDPRL